MKKLVLSILGVIIMAVSLAGFPMIHANANTNHPEEIQAEQAVLNASLQIRIFSGDGHYYDQGLATLVEWQDERFVMTHNHWTFLQEISKAELRDAEGSLLLELDAQTFQRLIRYSDPGTLIIAAPESLKMTPVSLGTSKNIQAGDMLVVAHQSLLDPDEIELLRVKVVAVGTYKGKTVFYYSNADREAFIVQGDSGGGVWFAGQYVGNNWGMYVNQKGPIWNRHTVQTTIAAQLPSGFLQTFQASQALEEIEPGQDPLSRWDHQETASEGND